MLSKTYATDWLVILAKSKLVANYHNPTEANLDREKQEVYKFKIDLKNEDGDIVPGPVWNAEFIVTDQNDNPPSIHENSKACFQLELKFRDRIIFERNF